MRWTVRFRRVSCENALYLLFISPVSRLASNSLWVTAISSSPVLPWVAQEKSRANTWKWHVQTVLSFCAPCLCSVFIPPQSCFSQNITVSGNLRLTGRAWSSPRIHNVHQRRTSWNQMFSKTRDLTCHIPASTLPTLTPPPITAKTRSALSRS